MPDIAPTSLNSHNPLARVNHASGSYEGPASLTAGTPRSVAAGSDRVELSDRAQFLDKLRALPEVRTARVEAVRDALAAGTYESDEKLDIAMSRLLDELG
jgi:negative regulator of flagellin synthesis FlgM